MQREVLPEKAVGTEAPKRSRDSLVYNADFSELVKLHWEQVFRVCLRITQNEHDAEDAAQDCFLRAFSHLHQFQGNALFSTWLNSIARNCSLMLLRKRRKRPQVRIENAPEPNGDPALFDPPDSRPDQLSCVLQVEILQERNHFGSVVEAASPHRTFGPCPPNDHVKAVLVREDDQLCFHRRMPPGTSVLRWNPVLGYRFIVTALARICIDSMPNLGRSGRGNGRHKPSASIISSA